ncbi:unnamed protein product, partial [Sphacelaria rigidula]
MVCTRSPRVSLNFAQLEDNPIIFCSDGFCAFTGYARDKVEGRNCRFLQG